MGLKKILENAPKGDILISDSIQLLSIRLKKYKKILCSVSGGSDSDILVDLCQRVDEERKIDYVFFDTGLEYQATKDHLDMLEKKYKIKIKRVKAQKPVPISCRDYGQPFLSKQVSEWIERLQRHNFRWEDEPFLKLYKRYPKCKAALRWWCNDFKKNKNGRESSFNINYNKYLKEFMIKNPPKFKISNKCCYYSKKEVARIYREKNGYDLNIYGVRKAEGGARGRAYKTCFSSKADCDEYRPLFWYLNETKKRYEEHYDIVHSICYSKYGLRRTGCAGCPFGKNFEEEIKKMSLFEIKLYKAVNNIFCDTYNYTREYRKFQLEMKKSKQ